MAYIIVTYNLTRVSNLMTLYILLGNYYIVIFFMM